VTYRPQSTDKWFNMAGIVAAYQPIAAPDHLAARQNMGAGLLGKYTATPGVAPTWSPVTGWRFAAAEHLKTGLIPTYTWTTICSFANSGNAVLFGSTYLKLFAWPFYNAGNSDWGWNNNDFLIAPRMLAGVVAYAGLNVYRNGVFDVAHTGTPALTTEMYLGAANNAGVAAFKWTGNAMAFAMYARTLTAAEVAIASRQMAYCTQPEFSVWARQRQYFYLPTTAYGRQLLFAEQSRVME
jgi:hypothetical protein